MSTPHESIAAIETIIRPALDEYGEAMGKHHHRWEPATGPTCTCGWTPRATMQEKSKRRAVGIHIAHEERKADKRYSEHCDELLAEARKAGWR